MITLYTLHYYEHPRAQNIMTSDTHISLNFSNDCGARLIDDCINLLDHIKVGLIVGVLDTSSAPRNVG